MKLKHSLKWGIKFSNKLFGTHDDVDKKVADSINYLHHSRATAGMDGIVRPRRVEKKEKNGMTGREYKYGIQIPDTVWESALMAYAIYTGQFIFAINSLKHILYFIWSVVGYRKPNDVAADLSWGNRFIKYVVKKNALLNQLDRIQPTSPAQIAPQHFIQSPADINIKAKIRGGVDFSMAKNSITFKGKDNSSFERGNVGPNVTLKSFKGFDFHIVEDQPIVNPVQVFLGSSTGINGTWFQTSLN